MYIGRHLCIYNKFLLLQKRWFGFLPIGFGLMIMGMLGELLRISLNLYQDKLR